MDFIYKFGIIWSSNWVR